MPVFMSVTLPICICFSRVLAALKVKGSGALLDQEWMRMMDD